MIIIGSDCLLLNINDLNISAIQVLKRYQMFLKVIFISVLH